MRAYPDLASVAGEVDLALDRGAFVVQVEEQLVEGGVEAQAERALQNLTAVLDAGGCTWADASR